MTVRENLYAAVFFAAVAVTSMFLVTALLPRRRFTKAADSLLVLILAISFWCSAYSLSFAHISIEAAERWLDITYVGILTAPTALLFFVARYTKLDAWILPSVRTALLAMPGVFAVAMFAPPFRSYFVGEGRNPSTGVLDHPGLTYWVYLIYVSGLMVVATTLTVRFVRSSGAIRRSAGALLVVAMALPWVASVISSANAYIFGLDPTVLSLGATTAIFCYLVLSQRLLDVGQLAREEMLQSMRDGFIALDNARVIVDVNERALELLELSSAQLLMQQVDAALASRPQLLDIAFTQGGGLIRLEESMQQERLLLVEVLPLNDRDGTPVGTTLVLRDQTRVYVDELTRIGNRRYFFDQVPHLVSVCQRSNVPVSLAILDVDGLKQINDTFGHLGGDRALVRVAGALRSQLRAVDVVARMGGDEFVVLLPGATDAQAAEIIERVRIALGASDDSMAVSVSAGISQISVDDSLLHVISTADRALYAAKGLGRDRVVHYAETEPGSPDQGNI